MNSDLIVEFINIAKPSATHIKKYEYKIVKTNSFNCWHIHNTDLLKIPTENVGILFDAECYVIQWRFNLQLDHDVVEKMLIYYWSGQNAVKTYCPLPPEVDEDFPVERLTQWSEVPLFFHGFQRKCIVLNGKPSNFNCHIPHLFIIRGEDVDEVHLYEVPCNAENLRSRASFLLVYPEKSVFIFWYGHNAIQEYIDYIKLCDPVRILKLWQKNWSEYHIKECNEGQESIEFKTTVGIQGTYLTKNVENMEWTPILYYLNSLSGVFTSTIVEYNLKQSNKVCPYPFLQSHLYTASKPAFFLLDNYTDIWLWEDILESTDNSEDTQNMSRAFLEDYHKKQTLKRNININVLVINANKEPKEFKILFPQWRHP